MLKCLNIECLNCKENQCKILCENSDGNCASRIIPRHTPNYAEEQLQHAIEKEKKGNNMDKDYKSLWEDSVKENKELEEENTSLANEKSDLEIENRQLTNEIKELKENLEFERNMYSDLKDTCKVLELKLKEEILQSKRIIKDLVSYL